MKHNARNAVLAGLLAASMAFSTVPVTAFAAPTSKRDVADSTVTINGLKAGDTVTAYQIADADIDANNSLTWKMTNGLPEAYDTIAELSQVASDGYSFTNVSTAAQTAAGAIAASSAVTGATASATATADGDSAKLTLGSGYYLVRVTNGQGNNDTVYQNMLVDLTPKAAENGVDYAAHDAVSATAKKETVSLGKKSHEANEQEFTTTEVKTFKVGDTVPFQITTAVPSYPAGATNAVFNVKDDPDEGLSIDPNTVKVTVDGTEVTAGDTTYSVSGGNGDGTAMSVTFVKDWILKHPGASVTITYSAALTENAKVTKTGETIDYTNNKATVEYSPDTNKTTTTETGYKTVDVHTYGVELQKVDKDQKALAGAEFTIYDANGNVVTSVGDQGKSISDSNGYVYFDGLAAGTYTLKETKVPAGKQKVDDITVELSDTTATADNPATDKVTEANFYQVDGDDKADGIQGVVDPDQGVLPTTGEAGTFAVTAAGVVLVAGGITLVMGARKRSQE